jgi:uncharacterized protein YceH (UPF0502 family)
MLRGPQTPGELKQRSERLGRFDGLAEVEAVLERLIARELVVRLARRPGQKEERYAQLLSDGSAPENGAVSAPAAAEVPAARGDDVEERLARLEQEVAALRDELAGMRTAVVRHPG